MRALLVVAAVALLYAAGPADAARKRVAQSKACTANAGVARAGLPTAARRGEARRRAALHRRCAADRRVRVGESRVALLGAPGSFAAPAPFATAPAPAAPVAAADPAAPAPPADPALPPVYSNPLAVQVRAYEFRFQLSKSAVAAGDVRVEFNLSAAEDPHNLFLVREDGTGPAYSFGEEPSGAVVSRTFPLTAGRWKLFCSLTGHEAAGMRATLSVG
jgi:plastocyanin